MRSVLLCNIFANSCYPLYIWHWKHWLYCFKICTKTFKAFGLCINELSIYWTHKGNPIFQTINTIMFAWLSIFMIIKVFPIREEIRYLKLFIMFFFLFLFFKILFQPLPFLLELSWSYMDHYYTSSWSVSIDWPCVGLISASPLEFISPF